MACQLPVDWDCVPQATTAHEAELRQQAGDAAAGIIWAVTGRRFGCCPVLIRPCPTGCEPYGTMISGWSGKWFAYLDGGVWRNAMCGCTGTCTVVGPRTIHLPGPVCSVTEVVVDGVPLLPADYSLEGDILYKTTGDWPTQDLQSPMGATGTWSVLLDKGYAPPAGTARVVGLLAAELFKSCCGQACSLPPRVTNVSRQGLNFSLPQASEFHKVGFGIPEIDWFVEAHNPNKLMQPARVSSIEHRAGLNG